MLLFIKKIILKEIFFTKFFLHNKFVFKLVFLKKKTIVKNKIFQRINSKLIKQINRNLILNLKVRFLLIKKKIKKKFQIMIS